MKSLLSLLLALGFLSCIAAVYMQVDTTGNVTYSDIASPNAKKLNISEATKAASPSNTPSAASATNPSTANKIPAAATVTVERKPYTLLEIASPKNQETLQNQQPTIPVIVNVEPSLQNNDKIQIFVDGQPWGPALKSTTFDLPKIDRGTHQIYAVILSDNNEVLKQTTSITIFVHYASQKNG